MKRHAQLVQFQEQGQEQKEEDEDEEAPEAEWEEKTIQRVDWHKDISRGGLFQEFGVKDKFIFKTLINTTVTYRFRTY